MYPRCSIYAPTIKNKLNRIRGIATMAVFEGKFAPVLSFTAFLDTLYSKYVILSIGGLCFQSIST